MNLPLVSFWSNDIPEGNANQQGQSHQSHIGARSGFIAVQLDNCCVPHLKATSAPNLNAVPNSIVICDAIDITPTIPTSIYPNR